MHKLKKSLLLACTALAVLTFLNGCSKTAQKLEAEVSEEEIDAINFGPNPGDG